MAFNNFSVLISDKYTKKYKTFGYIFKTDSKFIKNAETKQYDFRIFKL